MAIGDITFGGTSLSFGDDGDKPTATLGSVYVATDTSITYVCYDAGVWVNASPEILLTNMGDVELNEGTTDVLFTSAESAAESNSGTLKVFFSLELTDLSKFSAVNGFSVKCEDYSNYALNHETRVLLNDVSVGSITSATTGWTSRTFNVDSPLAVGDIIKFGARVTSSTFTVGVRKCSITGDVSFEPKKELTCVLTSY